MPASTMLLGGDVVTNNQSVRMDVDYRGYTPNIVLEDAINNSIQFMSQFSYLSELHLTPDPVWNKLTDAPIYTLRFYPSEFEGAEIYTAVNAESGDIISISPGRRVVEHLKRSPENTNLLSKDDIETCAYEFLSANNYTLSPYMRYIEPTLVNDTTFIGFHVYRLYFICIMNDTRVMGNGLRLELDIQTGEVLLFSYRWIHVESIPTVDRITALSAERNAVHHLQINHEIVGLIVTSSSLRFEDIESYPTHKFWLCWYIEIQHEDVGYVLVNAINGKILAIGWRMI